MISAVDSNVLFDVLIPGAPHLEPSRRALDDASRAGALILSDPVYAELAAHFADAADLERFVADTGLRLEPSGPQALTLAGKAWRLYQRRRPKGLACAQCGHIQDVACGRCGAPIAVRQHMVADFIVGAHASVHAGRLLTRDRGFYATYFPDLLLYPI
jgi:predicted nucleic acid-binding protein